MKSELVDLVLVNTEKSIFNSKVTFYDYSPIILSDAEESTHYSPKVFTSMITPEIQEIKTVFRNDIIVDDHGYRVISKNIVIFPFVRIRFEIEQRAYSGKMYYMQALITWE